MPSAAYKTTFQSILRCWNPFTLKIEQTSLGLVEVSGCHNENTKKMFVRRYFTKAKPKLGRRYRNRLGVV